jgi:hypothetical protein
MRPNSFINDDGYDIQQSESFDPWGDTLQYAPTPGNFRRSPTSLSDISCTNIEPISPNIYNCPQENGSQYNSLPLLQFGDWEEGRTYDEDRPVFTT